MIAEMPTNLRPGLLQREAAAALGISPRTLNNWLRSGHGPAPVRDGGRLLYDRAAVEAFRAGVRS